MWVDRGHEVKHGSFSSKLNHNFVKNGGWTLDRQPRVLGLMQTPNKHLEAE